MRECPYCRKGHWHEIVEYSTMCQGMPCVIGTRSVCPECGTPDPPVEETDRYYQCENCGYVERTPGPVELESE